MENKKKHFMTNSMEVKIDVFLVWYFSNSNSVVISKFGKRR